MILQQVYDPLTEKFQRRFVNGQFYIPGAYCTQIQRLQLPLSDRHGLPPTPTSIGAILFDTQQDLLWIGTDSARIISYYGHEFQREPSMTDLRCMSFLGKNCSEILVAGCQSVMYKIDVDKGLVVQEVFAPGEYTLMRFCRYLCAATSSGAIDIIDPDTLDVVKSWSAYSSSVSDMDAQDNYLVTCGRSTRPYGGASLESFARVYDLRKLEQLPPIPFHGVAAYVQLHPKLSTTSILCSTHGQVQVVDLMNPNTSNIHQVALHDLISHLVLAPSGAAWALASNDGAVQIWGASRHKLRFTQSAVPVEFADEDFPPPKMDIDSDFPLSTVGMPYYREKLLSAWPEDPVYEIGFLPPRIDPDILKHMSPSGVGYRAPNPRKSLRNQLDRLSIIDSNGVALAAPKFLSEKSHEGNGDLQKGRRISDVEAFNNPGVTGSTKADVPAMYRLMEIKYSRYGVDDFDFGYYNKTQYSGLETHITNSYLNPLLQLFKYIPLFRNQALHHTASSCLAEGCLLCELGFLFDMLEKAEGQKCHATNFLKAFSSLSEASKLQLTEETSPQSTLEVRIQAANRFLLKQIGMDHQRTAPGDGKVEHMLVSHAFTNMRCTSCYHETMRTHHKDLVDLSYHTMNLNPRVRTSTPAFSKILRDSFERDNNQRMWCDRCRRYQLVQSWESVSNVPPVLIINTGLNKQSDGRQLWSIPGWLPEKIGLCVDKGRILCLEGEALRASQKNRQSRPLAVYDLVGLVADVNSGENQKSHMVSVINVALSSRQQQDEPQWHLFNDFLVRKIGKDEALRFATTWKTPTILAYQFQGASNVIDDSWRDSLDTSCLFMNWSLNPYNVLHNNWPCVLDPATEQPGPGTHVPIDTEFVRLQQEEIEILATGDRQVIRPTREGLARVSVLRANGPHEGLPFIDDYISIPEPVVDYVTKYSGVTAGDLDPAVSTRPLVPLKIAYKKLWLLLNLGCIFVGHGLIKDFRNIDIFVPKSQIVDTVTLFYNPARSKRNLSLRFLAWYLLKEDIQSGNHDSIEDALTALKLWRKYQEYQDAGVVERIIDEIYMAGRKLNYKVPETGGERLIGALAVPSRGRDTPDGDSGVSGPSTPAGKKSGGSEYFESPLNISRSDLRTASSSPDPASLTEEVLEQWRHQLQKVYSNGYESQHTPGAATGAAQPPEPVPGQSHEDAYEFRLFSRKKQTAQSSTKIRIESPSPVSKEPGFVRARRSESYYFTGAGAHEESKRPLKQSAQITASLPLSASGKRKRSGKKRRIAIRIRTQTQRQRQDMLKRVEVDREAAEKEKRNRRNREKKIKRREKARAEKKGGDG
ncbi:MAG: hypothetical protein Q9184_001865 [Pyrenodesmia sp. 2 TL-2023]